MYAVMLFATAGCRWGCNKTEEAGHPQPPSGVCFATRLMRISPPPRLFGGTPLHHAAFFQKYHAQGDPKIVSHYQIIKKSY